MKLLAVESSAVTASVALFEDEQLRAQSLLDCGLTHSRTLMPQIEQLLHISETDMKDIDLFAVAAGPGSFTGVRIGVSCVMGLAFAAQKQVVAVSTLEAMAYGTSYHEGLVCPAMNARRNEVYTALFRVEGGSVTRLKPDSAIPIAELESWFADYDEDIYLVGDGAELVHASCLRTRLAPSQVRRQRADGVALFALAHPVLAQHPEQIEPTYLRLSQAEREKLERERELTQ